MSKKKSDDPDDDEEDLDEDDENAGLSAAEIEKLRAKHLKWKAFQARTDEPVKAEQDPRRAAGLKTPPPEKSVKSSAPAQSPVSTENYPEVMTIEQVAAYLQLHPQVVYRHVRNGTIPVSRIGRTVRFKKSILDAFLESGAWKSVGEFVKYQKAHGRMPNAEKENESPTEQSRRQRFSADID